METTGLDVYNDILVGICLYNPDLPSFYVPFNHTDLQNKRVEGQMTEEECKAVMLPYLANGSLKCINHNIKFDDKVVTFQWGQRIASDGSTDTSAVDKMLQYANQAYKTTGLSANEYMENVTSFSASLLSACAGDTNKSAEIANKAMIDMADNANKMGTDMGSIQNAYQGFAKQNYTMLDNLKLGYGGTKEEMDRLLKDAQAITGTKYDINNLADVYTAIGVIQDKLNITGTTAREAEQTFSGSFAMMKASVTNLLGNLSIGDGEAVARSMGELVESASTFFFGNFIPMLQTIFNNLPTAIGTAVEKVAPQIKENVLPLLTSIKDAIFTGLGNIGIDTGALQAIFDQLFNVKVDGGGIASMFSGLKDGIVQAINTILPIIPPIISAVQQIAPVVGQVISTIMSGVSQIIPYIVPVIQTITNIIVTAMPVIQQIITSLCVLVGFSKIIHITNLRK